MAESIDILSPTRAFRKADYCESDGSVTNNAADVPATCRIFQQQRFSWNDVTCVAVARFELHLTFQDEDPHANR